MMGRPVVIAAVLLALAWGGATVVQSINHTDPSVRILALDTSNSYVEEIGDCDTDLAPEVRAAVAQRDDMRVTTFDVGALGRRWAFERDYEALYSEVEVEDRRAWEEEQRDAGVAAIAAIAADADSRGGTAFLEQLEASAGTLAAADVESPRVAFCSDGQIFDEKVNVRDGFDLDAAIETWLPRLGDGLDGATISVVGFGNGIEDDEIRLSRAFLTELLEQAGATVEFDPGASASGSSD